ncbi:hypothetical protein [Sphingomonas bacterium]|uniref:hypothetical protein n=1 Tax=Sphingomonas bacterium TaxID=1895847 RepID=UPI0015775FD4|nr:hypothetical protein [Sphingomonas bacterium]
MTTASAKPQEKDGQQLETDPERKVWEAREAIRRQRGREREDQDRDHTRGRGR